jgi:hypothetical protein
LLEDRQRTGGRADGGNDFRFVWWQHLRRVLAFTGNGAPGPVTEPTPVVHYPF